MDFKRFARLGLDPLAIDIADVLFKKGRVFELRR